MNSNIRVYFTAEESILKIADILLSNKTQEVKLDLIRDILDDFEDN